MLATIEEFCKHYEHTIAAIGAISTFLAVVVSLALAWLSLRATKTRLKASLHLSFIMHDTLDRQNPPTYLTASITNIGTMALSVPLSFLRWRLPMGRGGWMVAPPLDYSATDPLIPQKKYPVEIAPRASQTFFLSDAATLKRTVVQMRKGANLIDRVRFRFIKAVINSDDGRRFVAKIDKEVRKHLRLGRSE